MAILLSVILPIVTKAAGALLATLGALAFNQLRTFLAAKTHNDTIDATLARLQALVTATVEGLEQSVVGGLRDSDGKLDDATAQLMRKRVMDKLNELYGADGIKQLAGQLKTSEDATISLIGTLLEQAVLRYKQAHPVVVQQTLPEFGGLRPGEVADNGVVYNPVATPVTAVPGGDHVNG